MEACGPALTMCAAGPNPCERVSGWGASRDMDISRKPHPAVSPFGDAVHFTG